MVKTTNGKTNTFTLSSKAKKNWFVFSVLILPTLGFLLFFVYVNFRSILMAFQRPVYTPSGLIEEFSIDNFRRIFTGTGTDFKELIQALQNTLIFFGSDMFLVFPVSVLMSYFFFKKLWGYRVFRFVYYLPSVISSSVLVVLFKYTIGAGGLVDAWMTARDIPYYSLLSKEPSALLTILFYNVMFSFGGNIIVIGGSMNGVSQEVLEAGKIDGCGFFKELVTLIIPMMWPTISTMLILKVTSILSASGPILAFTKGANGTMTLSYMLYALITGLGKSKDLYYASAVGIVMTLLVFPITLLVKHFVYSDKKDAEDTL